MMMMIVVVVMIVMVVIVQVVEPLVLFLLVWIGLSCARIEQTGHQTGRLIFGGHSFGRVGCLAERGRAWGLGRVRQVAVGAN